MILFGVKVLIDVKSVALFCYVNFGISAASVVSVHPLCDVLQTKRLKMSRIQKYAKLQ